MTTGRLNAYSNHMTALFLTACRWLIPGALAISGILLAADTKSAGEKLSLNYEIPLWEESKVPLAVGEGPLDKPFLTVFLPPEGKRNSGSVVVAPGGGNIMLMYGAEGLEIAGRAVMGGLSQRATLVYGPPPKIEAEARRAVEETGGRGLILAPGCSVPPRVRDANLAAMVTGLAA